MNKKYKKSKEKQEGSFNLFKTITSSIENRNVPEEDINKIPPFLFKRWLSNHPNGIMFAQVFNIYDNIPILQQYNTIKIAMKGKTKYIAYPKKIKDNQEDIEYLMKYYKISELVAQQYFDAMPISDVQAIKEKYTSTGLKGNK